jgi:hypothetical protein
MSTEETVLPEPTQTAPDATQTVPEVVTPEVDPAAEPKPEEAASKEDDATKAHKAMQRRIDRRTADLYQERALRTQLEQRLSALEANEGKPEQQAQADPMALAREIAAVERVTEKSNGIAKEGEKRFGAEWKPALETVAEDAGPLFKPNGKPTALGEAILDSDDPAALLHHLGKNPDLASDLHGLSEAQLGRRIGRIEAQMATKPPPKPVSKAPDPAKPMGATRSGTSPENMTYLEYKAMRQAQKPIWSR